ncbi:FlgO family outer membrane protein [Thiorhodospira sibirica]|uniref:FlgO family outer membrane protein n=1 Tax=Thiorhodospira sibirica TaxID=154347 RepID=UPI00022C04A0|nr:FlgO family outer membrane protein [Thiorhodospira sibirica]
MTYRIAQLMTVLLFMGFALQAQAFNKPYHGSYDMRYHSLESVVYTATDRLERNLIHPVDRVRPILFTSFVDIDRLSVSSTLGRLIGEQVASRMAQHGYRLVDPKLRSGPLVIQEGVGELALSRELRDVRTYPEAQAVLVGMYSVVNNQAIVSMRLLSREDNAMLAAHEFSMYLTPNLLNLAWQESRYSATSSQGLALASVPDPAPLLNLRNPEDAKAVQARLAELGFYRARIDGIWGPRSREALRQFRESRRLGTGAWDQSTQRALFD